MINILTIVIVTIFIMLGLWHFYMAFQGPAVIANSAAVPSHDGKPLFVPTAGMTIAVGVALILCAALVAATAGIISVNLPSQLLSGLVYLLAIALLARAVGEFKYVGFFKKVRGTRFATLDSLLYSPLCLLLSASVTMIATFTA